MTAPSGKGSGKLKRPHDTASPDNDTPCKKTLSDAPATPASDSSAVRRERARLTAGKSNQNCSGNQTPSRGGENNAGNAAEASSS